MSVCLSGLSAVSWLYRSASYLRHPCCVLDAENCRVILGEVKLTIDQTSTAQLTFSSPCMSQLQQNMHCLNSSDTSINVTYLLQLVIIGLALKVKCMCVTV